MSPTAADLVSGSAPLLGSEAVAAAASAFEYEREMMALLSVESDGGLRLVAVNRTYISTLSATGVSVNSAELVGRTFDEAAERLGLPPDVRASTRARFEQVAAGGGPLEYDEITPVRGGVFYGRTTLTLVPDPTGGRGHVLYSSCDVSAQRRIERALESSREQLANLLGNISGMAYRARNDAFWTMEFVSEGARRLTGYAPESLVDNRDVSWEAVIHPQDRDWLRALFDAEARPGQRSEATYRIVTACGETRWVFEQALAIASPDGSIACYEGIVTDVTALKEAELALREKERMLGAILDQSFQLTGLLDLEGRVLRANQAALTVAGVGLEAVVGRFFWDTPWWARLPGEQARVREAVSLAARGEFVRFQTVHPRADAPPMHIDFSLKPFFAEDGKVRFLIPEGRDITDIRSAQEAMRRSEEKFLRAFHGSPNAICISRLSDGRVIEVNDAFRRECAATVGDPRGRTSLELGFWTDPAEREEFLGLLRREGRLTNHLLRRQAPNGRWHALLLSVEPILLDGERCLLTTSVDVTARFEAERALRASEEKFAKAFANSHYSLTISSREDGRYLEVNFGFERLSGYRRDEVLGRTSTELGIWVDPDVRTEMLRRLAEQGAVRDFEISFRTKSGEVVIALCNIDPIELDGRPCLLSVTEDITARRRMEADKTRLESQLRQNQKLEALGTLAGGIAHDFNNILTAIIMNLELAQLDLDRPAQVKARLDAISRASNRAKNLVRQILAFSRQQPVARRSQSLAPLVRETLSFVRASLPSTIEIEQSIDPLVPAAFVDENQVHQVLMNLCTNAAHAMRERGGCLRISLDSVVLDEAACRDRPGLVPGRYARVVVADTGHGMDETVLARVFEPFFTTKGPGEGTGLGLSLVHGIMRDHDGGVWVRSRLGEGTEFELYFPADRGGEAGAAETEAGVVRGAGQSVLLVDDEPEVAEATAAMLRKLGYRVERYGESAVALERFLSQPEHFDLLLTDNTMPPPTGPELIVRLRAVRPDLPVVLMTGLRSATPDSAVGVGPHVALDKPAGLGALSQAVHRAFSVRPA